MKARPAEVRRSQHRHREIQHHQQGYHPEDDAYDRPHHGRNGDLPQNPPDDPENQNEDKQPDQKGKHGFGSV